MTTARLVIYKTKILTVKYTITFKYATICEKFNNYRFADHKEQVIELLQKVCTVSVKTMEIVNEMEAETVKIEKKKWYNFQTHGE